MTTFTTLRNSPKLYPMVICKYVFFLSCLIVFYNYLGYAIIAFVINKFIPGNKRPANIKEFYPSVSFIVAAYNEEDFIEKKILNSLEQNYPRQKIEFIFITDGSTDETAQIIAKYPSIKLLHDPLRSGKSTAINRAVSIASNDILIFSDANTTLNRDACFKISRHYTDPKTGGVAGEKKVIKSGNEQEDEVGAGEGLYWRYESVLKRIDAEFYSVVGAAGELFSLRRELYETVPANVILDDFVISLRVAKKGFRIAYEPEAFAIETPSFSIHDERKRKIRIAAGGFQSILMLSSLLRFWKQPRLSFLYISHRVLRWTLSPLCLVLAFFSNFILCLGYTSNVYKVLFLIQVCFYFMAFLSAYVLPNTRIKIMKLAYYFTFMNVSVFYGFFRFIKGSQSAVWEKAKRTQPKAT